MPDTKELSDNQKQLPLFEITTSNEYSNAINFYDLMPKYDYTKKRYIEINQDTSETTKNWVFDSNNFSIRIKPASIKKEVEGVERSFFVYPSTREEVVEDAIRKLATAGQGRMLDDFAGCFFTLYELKNELKRVGHSFSIPEIKEAIQVLSDSTMQVKDASGKSVVNSPFIASSGLTSQQELKTNSDAKCFVLFNMVVTKAIKELEFRQINYEKQMNFKTSLGRSIFKRLSILWIQASTSKDYGPVSIWTIFTNAGIPPNDRMLTNRRLVKRALDELENLKIIEGYEEKLYNKDGKETKGKAGVKIFDVKYTLFAHQDFIKDQKRSNHFRNRLQEIKDASSQ